MLLDGSASLNVIYLGMFLLNFEFTEYEDVSNSNIVFYAGYLNCLV